MKSVLVLLLCLVATRGGYSQDKLSKKELIKKLDQLIASYRTKYATIRFTTEGKYRGRETKVKDELVVGDGFGYLSQMGTRNVAMGFNGDYAFQIKKFGGGDKWMVFRVCPNAEDPKGYQSIRDYGSFNKASSLIGLSQVGELRNLLVGEIVKIKSQVKHQDGKIQLVFTNDPKGDLRRDEYDTKRIRLEDNDDGLSEMELHEALKRLGRRPTEVNHLECFVDPTNHFFVTRMHIRTVHKEGDILDFKFQCGKLVQRDGRVIPQSYKTVRTFDNISEEMTLKFESVSFFNDASDMRGLEIDKDKSRLSFYGLKEPEQ